MLKDTNCGNTLKKKGGGRVRVISGMKIELVM